MDADAPTIPALLARRRQGDRDVQAIVTAETSITYGDLDEESADLAARLVADGVVKGDRVGLLAPNGIAWVVHALAVARVGAVLVPLSTLLRPPELLAQLTTASVSHLIAVPEFRGRRYLSDLELAAPGLAPAVRSGGRHAAAPSLRRLWALGNLPERAVEPAFVACRRGAGTARRRPGRPVHLGEPRSTEGGRPHPRRRAPGHRGQLGSSLHTAG